MEMRDKKNQESADWLKAFNMRSEAMKRSIRVHAKLLEPKEVLSDKLQQHRSVLASKAAFQFHNLWLSHDNNYTAATAAQTVTIFSCTKACWPAKNERIRKRVAGYEGKSSWTALYVWAGEAGKWDNRMIVSLWKWQVPLHEKRDNHVCYRQKNARAQAEQMFRNKLKKYGITELFIQQHGDGNEEDSSSSRLNVNADESNSCSSRYAKGEFLGMLFM